MIRALNLQYKYPGRNSLVFPDISCKATQQLLITGPSGSGKTTLLHLLAGLRLPHSGEVFVQENSLSGMSSSKRDQFRGKYIGIVFQQMHFVGALNVLENITLQQYMAGQAENRKRAEELLDRLGLIDKKYQAIHRLSLGEQQRVALARALVNKPAVVLADEPTSSLDDANCLRVVKLLEELTASENAALVVVTHDQRLKELISNQVAL